MVSLILSIALSGAVYVIPPLASVGMGIWLYVLHRKRKQPWLKGEKPDNGLPPIIKE